MLYFLIMFIAASMLNHRAINRNYEIMGKPRQHSFGLAFVSWNVRSCYHKYINIHVLISAISYNIITSAIGTKEKP